MNSLSVIQLFTIMICGTCYSFITHFPFSHSNIQAAMITVIISSVIQFVLTLPAVYLKGRFQNHNVCTLLCKKNKPAGKIILALYTLIFMSAVFSLAGNFAFYLEMYFASYIPAVMIVVSCIFAAIYLGAMKTSVLGKVSTCAIVLFVIFTVAVIAGSSDKLSFINFNTADRNFSGVIFDGIKYDFAITWDLILFIFLIPDLQGGRKNALKTSALYFAAKIIILEILLAFITIILGDYGQTSELSFFSMASFSSSNFIQRFDAVFMLLWVIMALVKIGGFIHCAGRGLKLLIPRINFALCTIITAAVPMIASGIMLYLGKWSRRKYFSHGMWLQIILLAAIPLAALIICRKKSISKKEESE